MSFSLSADYFLIFFQECQHNPVYDAKSLSNNLDLEQPDSLIWAQTVCKGYQQMVLAV